MNDVYAREPWGNHWYVREEDYLKLREEVKKLKAAATYCALCGVSYPVAPDHPAYGVNCPVK